MTLTRREVNLINGNPGLIGKVEKLNEVRNKLIEKYPENGPRRFRILIYDERAPEVLDELSNAIDADDKRTIDEYTTVALYPIFIAAIIGVFLFIMIAFNTVKNIDLIFWAIAMACGLTAITTTIFMCKAWSKYEE